MKYKVSLNGKTYEIEVERGDAILLDVVEEPIAQPVVQAAAPVAPALAAPAASVTPAPAPAPVAAPAVPEDVVQAGEEINAPLPGVILDIKVSVGDSVEAGALLCILEAMKMENEIVSPKAGKIVQVVAVKGSQVENGQPLFVLA